MINCIALIAVGLALALSASIVHSRRSLAAAADAHMLPLPVKDTLLPSCFQAVCVYDPVSPTICAAVSTLTLARTFDPFFLVFADQRETLVVRLVLSGAFPCFYVVSRGVPLSHAGAAFSQPCRLYDQKTRNAAPGKAEQSYTFRGHVSEPVAAFAGSYAFERLVCSYLPTDGPVPPGGLQSHVELRVSLADLSPPLLSDFLGLFTGIEPETSKKYERLTREYRKWWAQEEAMARRGFFDRIALQAQKRQLKR